MELSYTKKQIFNMKKIEKTLTKVSGRKVEDFLKLTRKWSAEKA